MDTLSGSAVGVQLDKRVQLIEVAVFLFLIGPSLVLSLFLVHQGNVSFMLLAIATMLRDISLVTLILFFLWRNKEHVVKLGWTMQRARGEVVLGVALFVPMFFGAAALEKGLRRIGLSSPSAPLPSLEPSRSSFEMLIALILVVVVALAEETIFRGYLMLRFKALTGSIVWSVLLSAFVFSLGHGYEGSAGVVTVGTVGVILGFVYAWRESLVAPITMHFLQDFISIVLVGLLAGKSAGG